VGILMLRMLGRSRVTMPGWHGIHGYMSWYDMCVVGIRAKEKDWEKVHGEIRFAVTESIALLPIIPSTWTCASLPGDISLCHSSSYLSLFSRLSPSSLHR
jgi:hypothetical protein